MFRAGACTIVWLAFAAPAQAVELPMDRVDAVWVAGGLLATQGENAGGSCARVPDTVAAVARISGDGFGAARTLPFDFEAAPVSVGPRGFAAAVSETHRLNAYCQPVVTLYLADLDPFGRAVRRRPLSRRVVAWSTAAAARDGGAALAWMQAEPGLRRFSLHIAVRPAGGVLAHRVVARWEMEPDTMPDGGNVALAAQPGGYQLAWSQHDGRVRTAAFDVRGTVGGTQRLGRGTDGRISIRLGVARGGRAVIAWDDEDTAEEPDRPLRVHAATRAAGATRFAAARRVGRDGIVSEATRRGSIHLAVASSGRAVLAWSEFAANPDETYPERLLVATAGRRGGFGEAWEVLQLPGEHDALGDVHLTPDGWVLLAAAAGGEVAVHELPPDEHAIGSATHGDGTHPRFAMFGRDRYVVWRVQAPGRRPALVRAPVRP